MMKTIAAIAALALTAGAAHATVYNFSYDEGTGPLAGQLTGTLQADHNTILVSAVSDFVTFNGVAGPALPVVTSFQGFQGNPLIPASVTLDGSVMNLYACSDTSCAVGFEMGPSIYSPYTTIISSSQFGNFFDYYFYNSWSISSAAPEAGTWAMLIAGFGLTGAAMRRRAAVAA